MAQKSRSALKTDVDTTLPSGTGDIQAVNHRGLEDDVMDSHFNLITDWSDKIRLNETGSTTVQEGIQSLQSQINDITASGGVLLAGRTNTFTEGNLSVGASLGTVGGVTCVVSAKSGRDALFTFSFNSVGTSNYTILPNFYITGSDWNGANDVTLTGKSAAQTSFQVAYRSFDNNPTGQIRFALIRW